MIVFVSVSTVSALDSSLLLKTPPPPWVAEFPLTVTLYRVTAR